MLKKKANAKKRSGEDRINNSSSDEEMTDSEEDKGINNSLLCTYNIDQQIWYETFSKT